MKHSAPSLIALILLVGIGCNSAGGGTAGQMLRHVDGLGSIAFPNSGNAAAQSDFYEGVLLLHSFEFEPAAEAFRRAQEADPSFALAYWGEAMTYNHPLWRQVDLDAGREVLGRLADNQAARRARAGSEREAMYLDAVERLYGEGDKTQRDRAYMEAMQQLSDAYPDDDEARTFYSLSILGSENGARDFATYMKAAATAQPVFERNPLHPGAAHYLIHSFDDPIHAPLGLPAANAYSDIAPNAAHAQHMTTHIFVALGQWERVVENNIRAMNVQDADRAARGREPNACGHYSSWRHYGHLQLGQAAEAETLMDACHARAQSDDASAGEIGYFTSMRGLHVLDAGPSESAGTWDLPADHKLLAEAAEARWPSLQAYLFLDAYRAIEDGRLDEARRIAARFPRDNDHGAIYRMQLEGLMEIAGGRTDAGLALLRASAEAEAALPFAFGPPEIIKPTYELLGEQLLSAGRADEAREALRAAAGRTPGRAALTAAMASATSAS